MMLLFASYLILFPLLLNSGTVELLIRLTLCQSFLDEMRQCSFQTLLYGLLDCFNRSGSNLCNDFVFCLSVHIDYLLSWVSLSMRTV